MSFSPETFISIPEPKKAITLQPDIALGFQIMLMKEYFKEVDGEGKKVKMKINDDNVFKWTITYGKHFRDFCNAHPVTAMHINSGISTFDEDKGMYVYERNTSTEDKEKLTDEEIEELVAYMIAAQEEEDKESMVLH